MLPPSEQEEPNVIRQKPHRILYFTMFVPSGFSSPRRRGMGNPHLLHVLRVPRSCHHKRDFDSVSFRRFCTAQPGDRQKNRLTDRRTEQIDTDTIRPDSKWLQ